MNDSSAVELAFVIDDRDATCDSIAQAAVTIAGEIDADLSANPSTSTVRFCAGLDAAKDSGSVVPSASTARASLVVTGGWEREVAELVDDERYEATIRCTPDVEPTVRGGGRR